VIVSRHDGGMDTCRYMRWITPRPMEVGGWSLSPNLPYLYLFPRLFQVSTLIHNDTLSVHTLRSLRVGSLRPIT
jgi:hypothetical protein